MEGVSSNLKKDMKAQNKMPDMDDCIRELIKTGGIDVGNIIEAQKIMELIKNSKLEEDLKKNCGLFLMMVVNLSNKYLKDFSQAENLEPHQEETSEEEYDEDIHN